MIKTYSFIIIFLIIIGGSFVLWNNNQSSEVLVGCTEEAQMCPDGSFVGRTGPNCEFAECPVVDRATQPPTQVIVEQPGEQPLGACVRAGCSGQLCIDETLYDANGPITTCEFRPEYACYQAASCERQPSGECGFTPTDELAMCLANPPTDDENE